MTRARMKAQGKEIPANRTPPPICARVLLMT